MEKDRENVLKEAYYLELKGKALYKDAVREGMSAELRELFEFFAGEEEAHASMLKEQLKALKSGETLKPGSPSASAGGFPLPMKVVAKAVNAAGFEGALVSAALDFETRAHDFYSNQARNEADTDLKALYSWLADWERQHMALFAELDREIREKVWYDNSFWPLD